MLHVELLQLVLLQQVVKLRHDDQIFDDQYVQLELESEPHESQRCFCGDDSVRIKKL